MVLNVCPLIAQFLRELKAKEKYRGMFETQKFRKQDKVINWSRH